MTELVSYLEKRAGEYLRGVAVYDEERYRLEYVRDDLDDAKVQDAADSVYEAIAPKPTEQEELLREEAGEQYVTLQVREQAVILHLPWEDCRGTLVSLEPEAARQLTGFVNECMKYGYRGHADI